MSEDEEDHDKERQDKTNTDREIVHEHSDNDPSTQKMANMKRHQTLNFKNMEPFNCFQGLSHNPPFRRVMKDYFNLFVADLPMR
jgi:hypothetical protein